jgi:hypothetical protein
MSTSKHILIRMAVVTSCLIYVCGCNEPFSPKGPFVQQMVSYSVLNAQNDTQFVRLYLNYNPPAFDPHAVTTQQSDTTAQVTVTSGNQSFVFHDSILGPRLRAYVDRSFRPQPGNTYLLTIISQFGTVTATTSVPGHGVVSVPDQSTLLFPSSFAGNSINVDCLLGSSTKGFVVRFVLVFTLQSDTTFVGSTEIPLSYAQDASGQTIPASSQLQREVDPRPTISFPVDNYLQALAQVTAQYTTRIIPKQAKFYLIQVDEHAYDYYNVVNGFQDKFSIRTDQPDYSNIRNGLGVFGSFVTDSLVIHF